MKAQLNVYVVTQYASQANRRVVKVLELQESFSRMTLVCEPCEGIHSDILPVRKPRNATGLARLIGLDKLKYLLDQRLYFPSPTVLYTKAATERIRERVRQDLIGGRDVCIMTMTPPHELLLIGLVIKREFPQVRWIVDWQDLWSYDEYYFKQVAHHKRDRVKEIERQVFQECDMSVVTNPYAKSVVEKHYGVPGNKVVAISHPFDDRELKSQQSRNGKGMQKDRTIRIGFLGHLFKLPKVPGARVVNAFEHVRQLGIDVELHVFGDMQRTTHEAAKRLGWMVLHPRTNHQESLSLIANCDLLLLTLADLPNTQIIMHAKLPHYLMLNRPIVAMVPATSYVAAVIRETGTGHVISTDEDWGEGLTRVLRALSNNKGELKRNEKAISHYSWENISSQWVETISNTSISTGYSKQASSRA